GATVTGVQTCALPIWSPHSRGPDGNRDGGARECGDPVGCVLRLRQGRAGKVNGEQPRSCAADERDEFATFHSITSSARGGDGPEIGRAACREGVWRRG